MTRIRYHLAWALSVALLAALPTIVLAASLRPRLGVEAGPNLARMNSSGLIGNGNHWTLGGSAGLVASWDLVPGWSLEAAPGWERPSGRGTGTITLSSGGVDLIRTEFDQTIRFDRVALPVRAVFHPGRSPWSLEGGLSASWLAHAERTAGLTMDILAPPFAPMARRRTEPTARIFEDVGTFDSSDWTHLFHRWDAAAVVGLGWDRSFAAHVLRLRLRWQQGLTDVGKFDESVRVTAATATVGLLW